MIILETESFKQSIAKLQKAKYKSDYGLISREIFSFFQSNNTLDLVWQQPEFLSGNDIKRLNKTRIADSAKNRGKSYGYRIALLCNKELDTINLLYIFPKFGPERIPNIGDNFKQELVKEYNEQIQAGTLSRSIFNNAVLPPLVTKFCDGQIEKEFKVNCDHVEFIITAESQTIAKLKLDSSLYSTFGSLTGDEANHLKKEIKSHYFIV